jgi:hypothetical protein
MKCQYSTLGNHLFGRGRDGRCIIDTEHRLNFITNSLSFELESRDTVILIPSPSLQIKEGPGIRHKSFVTAPSSKKSTVKRASRTIDFPGIWHVVFCATFLLDFRLQPTPVETMAAQWKGKSKAAETESGSPLKTVEKDVETVVGPHWNWASPFFFSFWSTHRSTPDASSDRRRAKSVDAAVPGPRLATLRA